MSGVDAWTLTSWLQMGVAGKKDAQRFGLKARKGSTWLHVALNGKPVVKRSARAARMAAGRLFPDATEKKTAFSRAHP